MPIFDRTRSNLLLVKALVGAFVTSMFCTATGATNELAVGTTSRNQEDIAVGCNAPQNLNFKTRDEIFALRAQLVNTQPTLLARPYSPNEDVFGLVEDNKPWWGLHGEAVYGEGKQSIEGDSEESRFLLNPWILVGANTYSFGIWDKDKLSEEDLDRADFPLTWLPSSLTWSAAKSTAEVAYAVSDYNQKLYVWRDKMKDQKIAPQFALVAYNARDFGYNWLWVAPDSSTNIECLRKPTEPIRIAQFIHCGGSCGYPGGCNNMSPSIPALDEIKYTALPAIAHVCLWKQKPRSTEDAPDMTFIVRLQ
ncbi:MAG TPA: hypothetical protein V6C81_05545 [Planktothrix sp.]|jgi:hypothetical protein